MHYSSKRFQVNSSFLSDVVKTDALCTMMMTIARSATRFDHLSVNGVFVPFCLVPLFD